MRKVRAIDTYITGQMAKGPAHQKPPHSRDGDKANSSAYQRLFRDRERRREREWKANSPVYQRLLRDRERRAADHAVAPRARQTQVALKGYTKSFELDTVNDLGAVHTKIDLSWIDLRSISVRIEKVFTLI